MGGLIGQITDGLDNGAVANVFSVGNVAVPATHTTNTARSIGVNSDADAALVFSGVYHLAGSTCTNCDFGDDAQVSTQPTIGDFYDETKAPMNGFWNFTTIWQSNNPTALPTLR